MPKIFGKFLILCTLITLSAFVSKPEKWGNIKKIPLGENFPSEVNALIEIPQNSVGVKYEVNPESGIMFVDRFLSTSMHYPANYGIVPNTLEGDGDPLDILVVAPFQVQSGNVIPSRIIGVLIMEDNKGSDYKIIAVPTDRVTEEYSKISDITDLPDGIRNKIKHFFENYNNLEKGKWVKIGDFQNKEEAKKIILNARNNFKRKG
jgi:inorganic pyrophosphatase